MWAFVSTCKVHVCECAMACVGVEERVRVAERASLGVCLVPNCLPALPPLAICVSVSTASSHLPPRLTPSARVTW